MHCKNIGPKKEMLFYNKPKEYSKKKKKHYK